MSVRRHLTLLLGLILLAVPAQGAEVDPLPAPDLAVRVARLLGQDYYDSSRVRPPLMLDRGLRTLNNADVSVFATRARGEVLLRVGEKSWTIPAPEPQSLVDTMAIIDRIRLVLEGEAGFPLKRGRNLGYALINGALTSLDPHTVLMPPEPAENFDEDIRGEFGGIGAYLQQEPATGEVIIERVMPERPAEKAGVEDGDVIAAVNGESTSGLSLEQCVRRIKGPKGSTVTLTLRRKAQVLDIAIVRDIVLVPVMRSWRDGGIGYIRMDEFNARTARALFDEIIQLQQGGALEGLVLDLRFNGGGLLEQARIISDLFLPKDKEIVRTVTIGGEPNKFFSSPRRLLECPMIVLVGPGSASASEILSGALQRNDRAVVAGATTFGKGSVQSIRPLSDGSRLKLTIQEYRLADGISIQDVGVTPDLRLLRRMRRDDGRIDLMPFTSSREHDEEFALVVGDTDQHAATFALGWLAEARTRDELRQSGISSRDFVPDQEASLVIDLLRQALATDGAADRLAAAAVDGNERQALLDLLRVPVAVRTAAEAEALAAALAASTPPIIWGGAAEVPAEALGVTYTGPNTLMPGESAALTFTVSNSGTVDAGRLFGVLVTDPSSPFYEEEVIIGQVLAGGETVGRLDFAVPPRLHAGQERFVFELRQDGSPEPLQRLPVDVTIATAPRPHLALEWGLADAEQLLPGTTTTVNLTIRNVGTGASAPIGVFVYKDNDPMVTLGEGVFRREGLPPGGSDTVAVEVTLKPGAVGEANLQILAEERFEDDVDARFRSVLAHKLSIPIAQPVAGGTVSLPLIALKDVAVAADGSATVTVQIEGSDLLFLSAFHDRDKVDLRPATALEAGTYRFDIDLKPGLNALRVTASRAGDIVEVLSLRLWGAEKTQPETVKAPAVEQPVPVLIP